jgi:prolyl-tRNA synthetase
MEDLNDYYMKVHQGYKNIYNKIGLKNFISVKSDTGMMGGSVAHEFMSINEAGEDELVICDCGYKSNQEVAECVETAPANETILGEMKEVFTGDAKEIDAVCKLLETDAKHTVKAVAYAIKGEDGIVLAFVRGDKEINEAKLKKVTKKDIVPFSAENDSRLCAGNIGPIGLNLGAGCVVVYDNSLKNAVNMVIGSNKKEYHTTNVCISRDLPNINFYDIAKVQDGDVCPLCKTGKVHVAHGIEIGNIFQLGTKYTESMGMRVSGPDSKELTPIMGCYGIGVGRNLACIIEDNHDDYGIIMPKAIAPYPVHICALRLDDERVNETANKLYSDLENAGIECLFDDRNASPGIKFAEADLIGMPVRLVVSPKGLDENLVEIKDRATGEVIKVSPAEAVATIKSML